MQTDLIVPTPTDTIERSQTIEHDRTIEPVQITEPPTDAARKLRDFMRTYYGPHQYRIDYWAPGETLAGYPGDFIGALIWTPDVPKLRPRRWRALRAAGFFVKPWRSTSYISFNPKPEQTTQIDADDSLTRSTIRTETILDVVVQVIRVGSMYVVEIRQHDEDRRICTPTTLKGAAALFAFIVSMTKAIKKKLPGFDCVNPDKM